MTYKKINLFFVAVIILMIFFNVPVYNNWLNGKIFGDNTMEEFKHLDIDYRKASRYGYSYMVYLNIVEKVTDPKHAIILLPPNEYLKKINVGYFADGEKALKKRTISPSDISLDRIWLLNEGHCMRNQIINLCSDQVQKLQAERPYRYESSNVETLRKMVEKNGGMTVLPELATLEFTEDQIERIRYFEDPEPVREISLATNGHFVRMSVLQSLMDEILKLVPEKMRVQKKNRKVLRIQSAKLEL